MSTCRARMSGSVFTSSRQRLIAMPTVDGFIDPACSPASRSVQPVYRRMALQQLGPSCETGLIAPPANELEAELCEWVDVFERMHLILRLSPHLRDRYGD